MGGVESKVPCTKPLNPDVLSVITLSDAAVQRLPSKEEANPLAREARNKNIDQYWQERMQCLDKAYLEAHKITEFEFDRVEAQVLGFKKGTGKVLCDRLIDDTTSCYVSFKHESLTCRPIIKKLELCLDTLIQQSTKRRLREAEKKKKSEQKPEKCPKSQKQNKDAK